MNEAARSAFLRACAWDVGVRKPGNVSLASPGHGMDAAMFLASAEAAAGPMFDAGLGVGERIDRAGEATWAAAGLNTNLGILLLCAPLAAAHQRLGAVAVDGATLRATIESVLAALDVEDARHAFRAIARANPGGLGKVDAQDVHAAPTMSLREAMALAAPRDRIARQYRDGFADLFAIGLPALGDGRAPIDDAAVQRVYLAWLATVPDSHIVRKRGDAVAQGVMRQAAPWWRRARAGERLDTDPAFAAWDEALKSEAINPGTSADLTVAALFLAALIDPNRTLADAQNAETIGVPMGYAHGMDRDTVLVAGG